MGDMKGKPGAGLFDVRGRPMRDLRISVTDRCTFRCRCCMPREHFGSAHRYLERDDLLTVGEIERLAWLFVSVGVRKIRLTGGEPLLRRQIEDVVRALASIPGVGLAMAYTPLRLTAPLRRVSGAKGDPNSKFEEVSWDEALDTIAAKFLALRDQGEARAIANRTTGRPRAQARW